MDLNKIALTVRMCSRRSALYRLLGFKGDRLPKGMVGQKDLFETTYHTFWLNLAPGIRIKFVLYDKRPGHLKRLFVECPECARLVENGHYMQHAWTHVRDPAQRVFLQEEASEASLGAYVTEDWPGADQPALHWKWID